MSERDAVRRLLDRFGFGARPGELDRGFDETPARPLGPGANATAVGLSAAGSAPLPSSIPRPPRSAGDPADRKEAKRQRTEQDRELVVWWLDRMVSADIASGERFTWFWHGHFVPSEQNRRSAGLGWSFTELADRAGH